MRRLLERLDRLTAGAQRREQSTNCVLIYPAGQRPEHLPPGVVFAMPHNGREPVEVVHAHVAPAH